jgi:hypothetical protein
MANFFVRGNMLLIQWNMAISLSVQDSSKLSFADLAAEVCNLKHINAVRSELWHIFKTDPDRTYHLSQFSLNSTLTAKLNGQSQQRIAVSLNFCRLALVRKPEVSKQCSVVMFLILAKKNVWFERRQTLQHFNLWLPTVSPNRNLPKNRLHCRTALFRSVFTQASRQNKSSMYSLKKIRESRYHLFNAHRILMGTHHLRVMHHLCLTNTETQKQSQTWRVRLGAHWQLTSCGDKIVAVNVRALATEKLLVQATFFLSVQNGLHRDSICICSSA